MARSSRLSLSDDTAGMGMAAAGEAMPGAKREISTSMPEHAPMQWNCFAIGR